MIKSKKTVFSIAILVFYSFIGTATLHLSPPTVITILQITKAAIPVVELLLKAKAASEETTKTVNQSFKSMSAYLSSKEINTKMIAEMEASLVDMKAKADTLRNTLSQTKVQAENLFDLLEARADQNKTETLKEKMLEDIKSKKETFEKNMDIAEETLKKIDESIQKYDDVLGFIQVNTALSDVDQYIASVNNVIGQAETLNLNIQTAIDEGLSIVNALQNQPNPSDTKK